MVSLQYFLTLSSSSHTLIPLPEVSGPFGVQLPTHNVWCLVSYTLGVQSPPENGFMEPKYLAFRFGDYTPLAHHLTFGDWIS